LFIHESIYFTALKVFIFEIILKIMQFLGSESLFEVSFNLESTFFSREELMESYSSLFNTSFSKSEDRASINSSRFFYLILM
jgi:hypothetical protein